MKVTAAEASTMRCIVDVAEEFDVVPQPFEPYVVSARKKLADVGDGDVAFTAPEASAMLATTWAYMQRANMDEMPCYLADAINCFWAKLRKVQKDKPVTVFVRGERSSGGEGWYLIVNGEVLHGPFCSEERALFFWEVKPCPLKS
jgi:hypothetical protein